MLQFAIESLTQCTDNDTVADLKHLSSQLELNMLKSKNFLRFQNWSSEAWKMKVVRLQSYYCRPLAEHHLQHLLTVTVVCLSNSASDLA